MTTGNSTTQPTRRRVPAVVVGASLLLGLSGLARLAQVAAEAVTQNAYLKAHEALNTQIGTAAFAAVPMLFLMAVGLVVAVAALALLVLALANLAGMNWTRIATWIIGGVTLAVAGCRLALTLLPAGDDLPDTIDWDRVDAVAGQLMPAWVEPVATVSGVLASPALLVAVVLLALPPANAFYRSPQDEPVLVYPGTTVRLQDGPVRAEPGGGQTDA